ncbi:MAG TPA: hypothetical protein VGN54_00975, partial [Mycobacteriales bacterium]|nr:hypothetical protein [Mycobacteriales bacterium]
MEEISPPARRRRPSPEVWSVAEYGCHLRDVYVTYTIRLHRTGPSTGRCSSRCSMTCGRGAFATTTATSRPSWTSWTWPPPASSPRSITPGSIT